MRRSIVRLALVAGLTAVLGGAGAGTASAQTGCIGFPSIGGAAYHCAAVNPGPILPRVNPTGTTPVGVTIPAFCYFLDCTDRTPVGTTLPLAVDVSRPSQDVTVFRVSVACAATNMPPGCLQNYEIWYDAPSQYCVFKTDNPSIAALNNTKVQCVL